MLYLHSNRLTGEIPAELGDLINLGLLIPGQQPVDRATGGVGGPDQPAVAVPQQYQLTGCIPGGLRDVPLNDLGFN